MTEKRFIYKIKNGAMVIIDKKDNVLIRDKYRACDLLNQLNDENEQLKKELFETSKELLWATSDEVDRALHYEEEVEELRKEIFE